MVQVVIIIFAGLFISSCSPLAGESAKPAYHSIPFRTIGHRIPLIDALLNGKRASFIVDTGASITLLNAAQASYFGFSLRGIVRDHVVVKGFSSDLRLSKTSFCRIEIGPLRIGQVVYRSQEMNELFTTIENQEKLRIAGVLGSDILSRYRMNINYEDKTITYKLTGLK